MESQKHKENHQIPSDILDDLSCRFIINVPDEERSDFIRICFQIELAHWFYLDFYCAAEEEKLVPCGIKQFAYHIFHHIPFLSIHLERLNEIMNEFKLYKMSVPTYGAILMSSDLNHCLLVQSYWAKSSWGFPKGKVNEDEEPFHCAIREVYEETGYDISKLIQEDVYIEGVLNYQYTRLYIVKNVPINTVFIPRTRKEIKSCEWFSLDYLPTHKTDTVCKSNLGINANSFFMIMPFVKRLKRWLAEQQPGGKGDIQHLSVSDHKFLAQSSTSSTQTVGLTSILPQVNKIKKNNLSSSNGSKNACGNVGSAGNKKRQRHKSMGDLEGVHIKNAPPPVEPQKKSVVNLPVNNLMTISTSSAATTAASNKRNKSKQNFKRQLLFSTDSNDVVFSENSSANVQQPLTSSALVQCNNNSKANKMPKKRDQHQHIINVEEFFKNDFHIQQWNCFKFDKEFYANIQI